MPGVDWAFLRSKNQDSGTSGVDLTFATTLPLARDANVKSINSTRNLYC